MPDPSDLTEEEREALDNGELSEDELAARREAKAGPDPLSIEERAAAGENDGPPQPPPLEGEAQLSLGNMGKRGMPIESEISIMSKAHPIRGMLKPDTEVVLVLTARVAKYSFVPVRENDEVVRYKHVQQLRIISVAEANTNAGKVAIEGR